MGITAKPIGKIKRIMTKLQNEIDKENANLKKSVPARKNKRRDEDESI